MSIWQGKSLRNLLVEEEKLTEINEKSNLEELLQKLKLEIGKLKISELKVETGR